MAGSVDGGRRAAATNKAKYGESFYKRIGALGGVKGTTGGFYNDPARARQIGSLGGKVSKRGMTLLETTDTEIIYRDNKTGQLVRIARTNKS